MINPIAFIRRFFYRAASRNTVDNVTASFNRTVEDLQRIRKEKVAEAWSIEEQIRSLRNAQELADAEADRAHCISQKLEDIFS